MKIYKGWFICARCGAEKDRGICKTIKGKKVIVCMDCINRGTSHTGNHRRKDGGRSEGILFTTVGPYTGSNRTRAVRSKPYERPGRPPSNNCINAPQKSHGLAKAHPTCKTQVDTSLPRRNGYLSRSRDCGALNKGESSCQLQLI